MHVTLAVTDAMVQDCDLIMPVEILKELKAHAVSCMPVHYLAVTRSQSGTQQTHHTGQVDNTSTATNQTGADSHSDPVDDHDESVEHSSHAGTVVPECFKDDNASQWKSGKFDPHSLKNPRTDRHLNLRG